MEKEISEMTEREILRQQLELVAEKSKGAEELELQGLTLSMTDIIYSIDRISKEETPVDQTINSTEKKAETEQQYILRGFNESVKVQERLNRVQIACLIGILANWALFFTYLLWHL